MKLRRPPEFEGFQIGAVAAAVLLSFGIRMLVASANPALSRSVLDAMHYVIRQGGFGIRLQMSRIYVSWAAVASSAIPGMILLFLGLRLGAWVFKTRAKSTEQC